MNVIPATQTNMLQIAFQIKYTNTNFSPNEANPFLKCYLDARFDRDATKVHLNDENYVNASVSGKLKQGHQLTNTTALCFASIAWRKNENGSPCMMDTGVAHLELGQIEQEIKKNGKFSHRMPLIMYTVDRYQKAEVEIIIKELNCKLVPSFLSSSVMSVNSSIARHINSMLEMEQQMGETFGPQTSNMRIPYNYSESGIQSTNGTPLPAVSYVMSEVPRSNDHYWENAFLTVMDRDGLTADNWNRLNIKGKARASVHTVCYIAQYLDYIGDTLDKNQKGSKFDQSLVIPCENFGDGLGLIGGDCEDLGSANLQATNAFIAHKFNENGPLFQIMTEIQGILRQYVPPLSLDVVRGAQVSDQVVSYGAHMNDNYIPAHMFREWMGKTREGRQIMNSLPWPDKIDDSLPFLVGEGTGMYECLGVPNPLLSSMSYVYRLESLRAFKTPITRVEGAAGNFFVGMEVGLTDYFYKNGAKTPMAFWFCDIKKGMTRGASYSDAMNNFHNIAIRVQPNVSEPIMKQMEELTLRRLPPEPLILSPLAKDARRRHNSHLEYICKSINSLNRPTRDAHQKVPVYVRSHQLNRQVADRIISDFTGANRIWKVEYKLEEITDAIFGYRMNVWVK